MKCCDDSPRLQVRVDVASQNVIVLRDGVEIWRALCSTSKFGLGEEEGSFRTPTGKFRIVEKIGEGAAVGTVFKGRQAVGRLDPECPQYDQDLILTRILWLEGIEEHNANTRQRFIYFHGTNHEELIGSPASQGCIRLRAEDIVKMFDLVDRGAEVVIS